jgi:dihydroorotate dehydrogenase (NAD+) catalytic subunit
LTFDAKERAVLAALADVLIPAGEGFPSASQAGVAGEKLDEVLSFRPDLASGLKSLLAKARGRPAAAVVADWQKNDPDNFGLLGEIVPGAYFLNREVRARLGYDGQSARPIDPRPDPLEDGLLQSVVDRGPIYRPTSGHPRAECAARAPMNITSLPRYDWSQTYDWNYEHAPEPVPQEEMPVPGQWDYCGLPVASPLGIAAGPLLNGRWIRYYAALGFDVLTYKTVRTRHRACYPLPNLQPVEAAQIRGNEFVLPAASEMHGSWAVSFGMPSKDPEVWRADVEATRRALPRNKVLSVSVVATPEPDWTVDDIGDDFARCARWAIESGADCIEANFSCPNVTSADAQLYQQPDVAGLVAARIRAAIGSKPLLIKIGHVIEKSQAAALSKAVSLHSNGLVMVNCLSSTVLDGHQKPLFDGQKRGIAGEAIREAALEQVRLFTQVICQLGLKLALIGVGGIGTAAGARAHLQAGCSFVQLATAAMVQPGLGLLIRRELSGKKA